MMLLFIMYASDISGCIYIGNLNHGHNNL